MYTAGETDTFMELYQGDRLIAQNDDAEDYNARISFIPRRDGTDAYYLLVRGYDGTSIGEYRLCAETRTIRLDAYEPNNTRALATPIEAGKAQSGHTLSESDTEDWFSFTVETRGTYIVGTSGGVDTFINLVDDNNRSIKEDDDSGEDYNALLILHLEPGNYYIRVMRYDNNDEAYSVFLDPYTRN
jgi:small nuclear ribonucleoprotein (snRNP)-like protein